MQVLCVNPENENYMLNIIMKSPDSNKINKNKIRKTIFNPV